MQRLSFLLSITFLCTVLMLMSGCNDDDETPIPELIVDAGADQTICTDESVQLGAAPTAAGGVSPYTYAWTNNAASEANPTVSPTETTTYTLTVTDANGTSESDEVVITIAEPFTVDAGDDVTICPGSNLTLGGSPTGTGNGTYTYEWTNGAGATANPVVSPTANTTYKLTVTDEFGCTETDEIRVNISADFTVDAGNTAQICEGESITLGASPTVTGSGTYTFSWSDGSSEVATTTNPTIAPPISAVYTVTVTDANGCSKTASVEIGVTPIPGGSVTFNYTGAPQTFTFPDCITEVTVEVYGAQGSSGEFDLNNFGSGGSERAGGRGALSTGKIQFDQNLGSILNIYVGGQDGFNGGGTGGTSSLNAGGNGGGASDIRYGGTSLSNRIIVAGGGGGGAGATLGVLTNGGAASGKGGDAGTSGIDGESANSAGLPNPAQGGGGADQTSVGAGGSGQLPSNSNCNGESGLQGNMAVGGAGGFGGFNALDCDNAGAGGGGGGGGYFSGGGGGGGQGTGLAGSFPAAGGGGGSSYIGGVTNGSVTDGANSGNGKIVITWTGN